MANSTSYTLRFYETKEDQQLKKDIDNYQSEGFGTRAAYMKKLIKDGIRYQQIKKLDLDVLLADLPFKVLGMNAKNNIENFEDDLAKQMLQMSYTDEENLSK